jgi:hypothetical protein
MDGEQKKQEEESREWIKLWGPHVNEMEREEES